MIKTVALLTPIYVTVIWSLVFLIQKKTENKAKTTLGIFMLMGFLLYLSHAIFFYKQYQIYTFIECIYLFALLSLYPLFYRYIQQLANQKDNIKYEFLHYFPALLLSISSLVLAFALSANERIFYVKDSLIGKNLKHLNFNSIVGIKALILLLSRVFFIAQSFIYLTFGIKRALAHNQQITNYFSNTEGRQMIWIRNVSIVALLISSAGIAFALIGRSYFAKHELFLLIPSLLFGTFFFVIGFKGNQQLAISEKLTNHNETKDESEEVKNSEEEGQEEGLKLQILELFDTHKIYRHPDLRITNISEKLNTNRTYISRLINDEFQVNFNEFVNRYRVKEAKELLCNKNHSAFTMEYIAEKSGFGSVASFSRVFKELEGITPGRYKNKQRTKITF
jgi:AraC-like DNA-binding protein